MSASELLGMMTAEWGFGEKSAVNAATGFDKTKLMGKSVVVTGGASGMGEAMARAFVNAGAFVTIGDLSRERADPIIKELGEDKVAFSQCNVNVWSEQVQLFKTAATVSPSRSVDIVCANAGIGAKDTIWRDDAEPDGEPIEPDLSVLTTNIAAVMYTTKLAIHHFVRQPDADDRDRCLIITASLAGYIDQPGSPQYCSSKFAVRGLMRSLRRTMPTLAARVNIIAPWFVDTPIVGPEFVKTIKDHGIEFAHAEDAATAVLHISSDKSINGRALAIVPRSQAEQGYMDFSKDTDDVGEFIPYFRRS